MTLRRWLAECLVPPLYVVFLVIDAVTRRRISRAVAAEAEFVNTQPSRRGPRMPEGRR